jgi:release factor glutamine methyltransferase
MQQETWTISRMLDWMEGFLGSHDDASARLSAQLLVSHATGLSRTQLYMDMQCPLDASELDWLREAVKRRATGEPIQYITGTAPFRFLDIKCAPGVLIPRPETEVLVSEVLKRLPKPSRAHATDSEINEYGEILTPELSAKLNNREGGEGQAHGCVTAEKVTNSIQATGTKEANLPQKIFVADLCTGSGCVACSLASENPQLEVFASDVSETAVALARENVHAAGLEERVHVYMCDLGEGLPSALMGQYSCVVSNPPYIPSNVLAELPREVSDFEPTLALDGGTDGLGLFRRIVDWSWEALVPGGTLACELFEDAMDEAVRLLVVVGFADVHVIDDLAGRPRVVSASKPGDGLRTSSSSAC